MDRKRERDWEKDRGQGCGVCLLFFSLTTHRRLPHAFMLPLRFLMIIKKKKVCSIVCIIQHNTHSTPDRDGRR